MSVDLKKVCLQLHFVIAFTIVSIKYLFSIEKHVLR